MSRRRSEPVEIAEGVYWLSFGLLSGNVYLIRSERSWVLIDAATEGCAGAIRGAAESLFGVEAPPAAILITHVHPDHVGAARELALHWGCSVHVPRDELALACARDLATVERFANPLDHRIILPAMRALPRRRAEAILSKQSLEDIVEAFEPAGEPPGLAGWTAISTPGHSPGHVVFWREGDRVLISGDAVLTVDAGSVRGVLAGLLRPATPRVASPARYTNWDDAMAVTAVVAVARLKPTVLGPGHGPPMIGEGTALALRSHAEQLVAGE